MAAKRIRVSSDNVTYYTLPGATGEKRTERSTFDDTVFGQSFASTNGSLSSAMISGNAFFKGVAGYTAKIMKSGTPTTMTAEAMSLVSGKTYRITAAIKRAIDYASSATVFDNAVDQTANVLSIDYLNGSVTFKSTYTPTGPITITGKYLPMTQLAKGRSFTLTQTVPEVENTTYEVAQGNSAWRTYQYGLRTVTLEVGAIFDAAETFITDMNAGSIVLIEINPNGSTDTVARGNFARVGHSQSGNVGALEETTYTFNLYVPDGQLVENAFKWYFTSSTLNPGVMKSIDAWQLGTNVYVQYLPDGVAGTQFSAIVTECSLTNNIEGQNEFRFNYRATGAPTVV